MRVTLLQRKIFIKEEGERQAMNSLYRTMRYKFQKILTRFILNKIAGEECVDNLGLSKQIIIRLNMIRIIDKIY